MVRHTIRVIRYNGISFGLLLEAALALHKQHVLVYFQVNKQLSLGSSAPQQITKVMNLSSITSLTELLPSHDLLIGVQGQGVWRYKVSSPNEQRGHLTQISTSPFQYVTPFNLSVKGKLLYIAGTHGLSIRDLDSLDSAERLIDSNAVFDLAWLDQKPNRTLAYTCGELGIAYVNSSYESSKIIFSRSAEGKACRGLVSLPASDQSKSTLGHFALFEDRLYYIENQNVFRVPCPRFKVNWGQKPFIDQSGQLWIPTQKALLRYGHYQEARKAALQGEFLQPKESLAIANGRALYQLSHQTKVRGEVNEDASNSYHRFG